MKELQKKKLLKLLFNSYKDFLFKDEVLAKYYIPLCLFVNYLKFQKIISSEESDVLKGLIHKHWPTDATESRGWYSYDKQGALRRIEHMKTLLKKKEL